MKKCTLSLALITILAVQSGAQTPTLEGTVGVGAGIGGQRYRGSFGDYGTVFYRGILSYHPTEWLGTRVVGGYGELSNNGQKGVDYSTEWFSNLGLDLVLQPQIAMGAFRPYLASGIASTFGTSQIDDRNIHNLDWNLYVPVELGLEYLIASNLSIWLAGETYAYMQDWDDLDGTTSSGSYWRRRDDLQKVSIGFTFLIGSKMDADHDGVLDEVDQCPGSLSKHPVDAKGCHLDGDKDGVYDHKDLCPITAPNAPVDESGCTLDADRDNVLDKADKCPNTPIGVKVDNTGCPSGAADTDMDGASDAIDKCPGTLPGTLVDAVGCPVDTDKDGVSDEMDKCPGTPEGSKVDAGGCLPPAADADRDGVSDAIDQCPGTRVGVKVDSVGCTLIILTSGTKLIMDGILFETGSAKIDMASTPVLGRAVVAISKAPQAKIEIAGFTDNVGSESSNQKLSERRAMAVKAFLVRAGVPSSQLTANGYGESDPIADNSSEESRYENRRIEFHVK